MQKRIVTLFGTGLMLAVQNAPAQNPNASQIVQNNEQRRQYESAMDGTNAPELYAGETSDLGQQTVLNTHPHRWHLVAAADEQMFITDNMFLDRSLYEHATVNVSTIQLALEAPPVKLLGGDLTARVAAQMQWYTYGLFGNSHVTIADLGAAKGFFIPNSIASLDTFDFNAQTAFADLTWTRDNWMINFGFNFQRLTDSGQYNEFYREYTPNLTVEKTFAICPRLSATLGGSADIRFTISQNPPSTFGKDLNNRSDEAVYGLLNFKLCDYAILQPYYRFQFAYYNGQRRDDYLNSCGLNLLLPINRNISLRAYYSYQWMETDSQFAVSYHEMEGGLGASLEMRF